MVGTATVWTLPVGQPVASWPGAMPSRGWPAASRSLAPDRGGHKWVSRNGSPGSYTWIRGAGFPLSPMPTVKGAVAGPAEARYCIDHHQLAGLDPGFQVDG